MLVFSGAGRRGAAVFLRGMTAWIVLQDAGPLDTAKLKAALGTFPEQVDAESGNGLSVLRITLKEPEQISAMAEGSNPKSLSRPKSNRTPSPSAFRATKTMRPILRLRRCFQAQIGP